MFCEAIERISYGLKNEFELAVVNEPSVFELLRFDCICLISPSFDFSGKPCFVFVVFPDYLLKRFFISAIISFMHV